VKGFLATYTNITIVEKEFSEKPNDSDTLFLEIGSLRDALNEVKKNSVITVDVALKLIREK